MKTTDFRIGNYANAGIVIQIHQDYITCAGNYLISDTASFSEKQIRPYPLTEDFLLKHGFRKYGLEYMIMGVSIVLFENEFF